MKEIVKFDSEKPIMRDECIFWRDDDPGWGEQPHNGNGYHKRRVLDMENDSYVWCFTGPKRSGKTSYMTYLALKIAHMYGKRIVSNYPMAIDVRNRDLTVTQIRSENLDLGKLFQFDASYADSLIVLDEAPQVINRLAIMSWKNRLLDLYLQKLGHENISMLYASQDETLERGWVDPALRFQTDVLVQCRDASRRYQGAGYKPGAMVLANLFDKSGSWTGYRYWEKPKIYKRRVLTELIWGSFDTHLRFDVFESLRGVAMDLEKYKVTDKPQGNDLQSSIEKVKQALGEGIAKGKMKINDFYDSIGDLSQKQKTQIGSMLTKAGVRRGGHGIGSFDFSNVDTEALGL